MAAREPITASVEESIAASEMTSLMPDVHKHSVARTTQEETMLPAMAALPVGSGGSATSLSATGAWAEPLPVMRN
jgi:hypothetical protein